MTVTVRLQADPSACQLQTCSTTPPLELSVSVPEALPGAIARRAAGLSAGQALGTLL